ncbi:MAG: hypothetical protein R6V35_03415 [Candidatus Nanohaloarchaea archaeon]
MIKKRRAIFIIAFIVILSGGLIAIIASGIYTPFYQGDPFFSKEWPELNTSYDSENEELTLAVEEGAFTQLRSTHIRFYQSNGESNTNFTLKTDGREKKTNYWAKDGLLTFNSEGLTRFPILPGDSVTLELGESREDIAVMTIHGGARTTNYILVFENESVKVTHLGEKMDRIEENRENRTIE